MRRREFSTIFLGSLFNHNSLCGARTKNKTDGTIDSITFSNKTVKSNLPEAEGPKSVSGRTFSEELASMALVAESSLQFHNGARDIHIMIRHIRQVGYLMLRSNDEIA
jgi:hypothetical protein